MWPFKQKPQHNSYCPSFYCFFTRLNETLVSPILFAATYISSVERVDGLKNNKTFLHVQYSIIIACDLSRFNWRPGELKGPGQNIGISNRDFSRFVRLNSQVLIKTVRRQIAEKKRKKSSRVVSQVKTSRRIYSLCFDTIRLILTYLKINLATLLLSDEK